MWWICLLLLCSAVSGNNEWDLLIFTQHWPPSACIQYMQENSHHTCVKPKIDKMWTIHGIWPTKLGTIGPSYCSNTTFDPKQIADVEFDLEKYWPNLEGGKTETSLWEHEWEKHGTCATSVDALKNELDYFVKGMAWFNKYFMNYILGNHNISPSETAEYHVTDIQSALKAETGVNPSIQCIFDLRLCFDKNLKLADCDGTLLGSSDIVTNCPLNETIGYPAQATVLPQPPSQKKRSTAEQLYAIIDFLMFIDWLI